MTIRIDHGGSLGPWKGRAFLSVGRALYLGPAGDTTPHAHHALQVSVGLDAPFRLRQGVGRWREYEAAIIPADVPHQLDGRWTDLLLLYLDPESAEGHPWLARSRNEIQVLSPVTTSTMRAAIHSLVSSSPHEVDLLSFYDELLPCAQLGLAPREMLDARVAKAMRRLRESYDVRRSLLDLALEVGLSPSHFRHLFRREIGMSAQSYIVWLRINAACSALAGGASLSGAAHHGGFSDAAHFTRTFRRTFGLAPSQLAGRLTLLETLTEDGTQGELRTGLARERSIRSQIASTKPWSTRLSGAGGSSTRGA